MSDATGTFTAEDIRFGGGVGESDRALVAETMRRSSAGWGSSASRRTPS